MIPLLPFLTENNRLAVCLTIWLVMVCQAASAATVITLATSPGPTPDIVGYNLAHFFPGGNAATWLRYSGVNGVRMFISPAALGESFASDDLAPWGDGVADEASFITRRTALRASQLTVGTSGSGPYINWNFFSPLYARNLGINGSTNEIVPTEALSQLRGMNMEVLVNISASPNAFPISSVNDWAGKWELWQHYYAQAFYLAKNYDVKRYQMFNEPDASTSGLPGSVNFTYLVDYVMRLKLASDAVQSALADVNAKYGKVLQPAILSPVTTHGESDYFGTGPGDDWGHQVVTNRHTNYLEEVNLSTQLIHQYDFHKYGSNAADYDANVTALKGYLAMDQGSEPPIPVSLSEFNTHTAAQFAALSTTLDSPTEYTNLAGIGLSLLKAQANEMYCFKFGQTVRTGTSEATQTVVKNGTHYVDNWNEPYNVGGVTKAGEAWRLVNKGFTAGRSLRNYSRSSNVLDPLQISASYDPVTKCYYLLLVNGGPANLTFDINTSAWNLPEGNHWLLEEVSETRFGSGRTWGTVGAGNVLLDANGANSFTQAAYTVWLCTLPSQAQTPEHTAAVLEDAMVKDGAFTNTSANFGTATSLLVANTTASIPNGRNAALLKFQLPTEYTLADLQLAVLSVRASITPGKLTGSAHVYGLPNTSSNWTENSVTWITAPNLSTNVSGGASISNNFVLGGNAALSSGNALMMCGQLVATSGVPQECLLDVTSFLRSQTAHDHEASFLLTRDVRFYNDAIDSDGITLTAKEGGSANAARLRLVFKKALKAQRTVSTEATIHFATPDTDFDEVARGYLMVKYDAVSSGLTAARKSYFQFDLGSADVNPQAPAALTIRFTDNYAQRVQLWGLTQAYPTFTATATWNNAQANELTTNNLLTSGNFKATQIGSSVLVTPGSALTPYTFNLPRLSDFLFGGRITLALTGVSDAGNNSSGLRMARNAATLQFALNTPIQSWWLANFQTTEMLTGSYTTQADTDADGVGNLLEYAQGSDPLRIDGAGKLPVLERIGNELRFTYRKAAADLDYLVEQSSNLGLGQPWSPVAAPEQALGADLFFRVLPQSEHRMLFRLKVSTLVSAP